MNSISPPAISVIIPAYNAAEFLPETIESALAQNYQPLEIIVVDDGSTDSTPSVLESFGNQIRVIRQPNAGLGRARNRGIAESSGAWIALLDADDRWLPGKLQKQVAVLRDNPRVGLVHTDAYDWTPENNQRQLRDRGRREFQGTCLARLSVNNRVLPSTVLMKRACIDQLGDFDPVPKGVEDWDLWLRIAEHYEFAYVDEPLVDYRRHGANMSGNSLQMRIGELYVLRKSLKTMPALAPQAKQPEMKRRLHQLAFDIGYQYFSQNKPREARRYFREALSSYGFSVKTASYWLASFLPGGTLGAMRKQKQQLWSGTAERC